MTRQQIRALRLAFVVGYIHGRSSLANHEPAGHDAEAAFERWFAEVGEQRAREILEAA